MKEKYAYELDRILEFAVQQTDSAGKIVVDGEIDCKDSGWLVLAAVIRLKFKNQFPINYPLESIIEKWTFASVDVDDQRSAWTTFALLYAMYISGGKDGFFYQALSSDTADALDRFVMQIDMQFLYDASRNYQVAAGLINTLRLRFGYIVNAESLPEDNIKVMIDAYLGDGFFNDDDNRGSGLDRRIDAYSAEIIGLLLHYDEINNWQSPWHNQIVTIVNDFCASNIYLIDSHGEYAKWGRSLRGEAEAKKLFIWEFAEKNNLVANPGDGVAACSAQLNFFLENGIGADGQVFRDKAGNRGTWDEYTTHVQAQGYGAYGIAMALYFASADDDKAKSLPSQTESYVRYLPGPQIICANDCQSILHCIIPGANRLTKLMYLWHNRITGENDVSVDMSPKFMPLPYFGKMLPAPYADPRIPFLPLLITTKNELLVPRNLNSDALKIDVTGNQTIRCKQNFAYSKPKDFEPVAPFELTSILEVSPTVLAYEFEFQLAPETDIQGCIYFYYGEGTVKTMGDHAKIDKNQICLNYEFSGNNVTWEQLSCAPSVYGAETAALRASFPITNGSKINYRMHWGCK